MVVWQNSWIFVVRSLVNVSSGYIYHVNWITVLLRNYSLLGSKRLLAILSF